LTTFRFSIYSDIHGLSMRITGKQLRQIIREELSQDLDEMAYGGRLGLAFSRKSPKQFGAGGGGTYDANPTAAAKFATSRSYEDKALKLYGNIPYRVFVAPFIGNIDDLDLGMMGFDIRRGARDRGAVLPLDEQAIRDLRRLGFRDIPADLGGSDLVILYTSAGAEGKMFNASPWMAFHAFFNIGGSPGEDNPHVDAISPTFKELIDRYWAQDPSDPLFPVLSQDFEDEIAQYLTMGSARNGWLDGGFIEAAPEMLTQEILDRRKLRFNEKLKMADPGVRDALLGLKRTIATAASEALQNMQGKLLVIDVS